MEVDEHSSITPDSFDTHDRSSLQSVLKRQYSKDKPEKPESAEEETRATENKTMITMGRYFLSRKRGRRYRIIVNDVW